MSTESSMSNGQMAQLVTLASEAIASAGLDKRAAQSLIGRGKRTKKSIAEALFRLAGFNSINLPLKTSRLRALVKMFPKGRSFILTEIDSLKEVPRKFDSITRSVQLVVPPQYFGDEVTSSRHVFVPDVEEWVLPDSTNKTAGAQRKMVEDFQTASGTTAEIGTVEKYCEILFQWFQLHGQFPKALIDGKSIRTSSQDRGGGPAKNNAYTISLVNDSGIIRIVIASIPDWADDEIGVVPLIVE